MMRRPISALTLSLLMASSACSISVEPGFSAQCVQSIASDAARNTATPTFAANIASETGLVPDANPDGPSVPTKQVEFRTPDGAMHYFAVPQPFANRAALIRATSTERGQLMRIYAIDENGVLQRATQVQGLPVVQLNVSDASVQADFRAEQELWRAAGRDDVCGR